MYHMRTIPEAQEGLQAVTAALIISLFLSMTFSGHSLDSVLGDQGGRRASCPILKKPLCAARFYQQQISYAWEILRHDTSEGEGRVY